MSLAIHARPSAGAEGVGKPHRLARRCLNETRRAEFPRGTDIRVDARIEPRGFQAEVAAIDQETPQPGLPAAQAFGATPRRRPGARNSPRRQCHAGRNARRAAAGGNQRPRFGGAHLPAHFHASGGRRPPAVSARRSDAGLDEALFRVSIKAVSVGDRFTDGSLAKIDVWLNARMLLSLTEPPGQYLPFVWLTAISVLIGLVAFWGVRKATEPLSVFASAAERLGVDVNAAALDERGPSEVNRAARAFNTMQTRLQRFIQDRTQMLAAISHDLRTPITRLRLRAEFIDDDVQRRKMLTDLEEMEAMISATLVFARDDAANEAATHVDATPPSSRHACFDQNAAGRDVTYNGPDSFDLMRCVRSLLKRARSTISSTTRSSTAARARVTMVPHRADVSIIVDDDGPGIPAARHGAGIRAPSSASNARVHGKPAALASASPSPATPSAAWAATCNSPTAPKAASRVLRLPCPSPRNSCSPRSRRYSLPLPPWAADQATGSFRNSRTPASAGAEKCFPASAASSTSRQVQR